MASTTPQSSDGTPSAKTPELPPLDISNCLQPLLIEIKLSPIHGVGVFSKVKIGLNETILAELPSFAVEEFSGNSLLNALNKLDPIERAAFDGLHKTSDIVAMSTDFQRFTTNAFDLANPSEQTYHKAIFLVAAQVNHSATPNASMMWADGVERMMFFALRDIDPGEEITVGYCCTRQAEAHTRPFQCNCPVCVLAPADQPDGPCICPSTDHQEPVGGVDTSASWVEAEIQAEIDRQRAEREAKWEAEWEDDERKAIRASLRLPSLTISQINRNIEEANNRPAPAAAAAVDDDDNEDFYVYDGADSDENEAFYSDGDDDDFDNLDIRPGVHTFLE